MLEFGRWDAARGWTKQLHLGALRNNNTRLLTKLGPDTGFDSIGDFPQAAALSRYLNALDSTDQLPRTILTEVRLQDENPTRAIGEHRHQQHEPRQRCSDSEPHDASEATAHAAHHRPRRLDSSALPSLRPALTSP